jgi:RsiW-degrading membrane proteinase PrsW (M82 family)
MMAYAVEFFVSFFSNPNIMGIVLAVAFGAVWLASFWPPLRKELWLWAVLVGSAILTLVTVSFIQIPLQAGVGRALRGSWGPTSDPRGLLLVGLPAVVISGLVQEGSKLAPVVVYWFRKGKSVDLKLGLVIGAVAGAGFGIFEAQWAHNSIYAAGWSWATVQTQGIVALVGFWERFFAVAFHVAASALAGYGLVKGKGWQFYLIASLLHAFLNYSVLFLQSGLLSIIQVEIFIAVVAILVAGWALWLRWRKNTPEIKDN